MNIHFQGSSIYTKSSVQPIATKTSPGNNSLVHKNQLSKLLFGHHKQSSLTFGWSKGLSNLETEILDILTDPTIKTAVVASHKFPDEDAYGSAIGIAAILNKMGVADVHTVIDAEPAKSLTNMPSALPGKLATKYIGQPQKVLNLLKNGNIKNLDVMVITDTAIPRLAKDKVIEIADKANKVIIIDHHSDSPAMPTNESLWKKELVANGVKPENIIYYRKERTSTSEMVAEFDREIDLEATKKSMPNYIPDYYKGYRLSLAGAMVADTTSNLTEKGQVFDTKFTQYSKQMVQSTNGKPESITRNVFTWLIKNCGIEPKEIDIKKTITLPLPESISQELDAVLNGDLKVDGIEVKKATKKDPIQYIIFNSEDYLKDLANRASKEVKGLKIAANNINYEISRRIDDITRNNVDVGLFIKVSNAPKDYFSASFRSYGNEFKNGEAHIEGHRITDSLAGIVTQKLTQRKIGVGGGHENATGFKSLDNKNFKEDALPVIKEIVERFFNSEFDE